jgi:ankyrin repeat protein
MTLTYLLMSIRKLSKFCPPSKAIIRRNIPLAELLLESGASADIQDVLGCTPIHYSIFSHDTQSFAMLMTYMQKWDVVDKVG